jgi:hypothetical protein
MDVLLLLRAYVSVMCLPSRCLDMGICVTVSTLFIDIFLAGKYHMSFKVSADVLVGPHEKCPLFLSEFNPR